MAGRSLGIGNIDPPILITLTDVGNDGSRYRLSVVGKVSVARLDGHSPCLSCLLSHGTRAASSVTVRESA